MSNIRILVVDDEGPTRTFICDGLSALGITDDAVGVGSAEDALAAAEQQPPDLVISDVRMPGLNGLDLARYLHQIHPDTKVILITGYSTRDIEKAALALAVDALIKKPFGLEALGEAVRRALSHAHASRSSNGLSPALIEPLMRHIDILKRDVGAQWIGLLDADGKIILNSGSTEDMDETLTQLLSQGWTSMISLISDRTGPCFMYIEGQPHDIYLTSVDRKYSLAFIYDRRWQTNRVGAVWLTAKHTVQELARLLSNQPQLGPPQARLVPDYALHIPSVEP
jgi:CheY-like chemotaxis protein/predicted regulator of Ras-like GTPase activity (Roadblock/LC7/MglB family)